MRTFVAITFFCFAASSVGLPTSASNADARFADTPAVEAPALVSWSELCERPCRWLGRKVRVRMQYESELTDWNAYMTRFGTGQFDALRAWSDEQLPWIEQEFHAPEGLLFVRKGSAQQHALDSAKTYSRYECTIQVREVFLDTPWAEIIDVRPMAEQIREATVIHAARAIELMNERSFDLAKLELDVALEAPLPEAPLHALKLLRDACENPLERAPK
jgi:hypothetical protein